MRIFILFISLTIAGICPQAVLSQQSMNEKCESAGRLVAAGRTIEATVLLHEILTSRIEEDSIKAKAYTQYGWCQKELGNLDSVMYFLKKAADIWHSKGDKPHLVKIYSDIGSLLSTSADPREAIKFYRDALTYSISAKDSLLLYIRMCASFLNHELYDSAYYLVQNNFSIHNDENFPYKTYYTELSIGMYFRAKGQYPDAVYHLKKASVAPVSNRRYTANVFPYIAEMYSETGNHALASQYADSAYKLAKEDGGVENLLLVYGLKEKLYKAAGNFQKALTNAELSQKLSDSINKADKEAAFTDAAEKYKNEKIQAAKDLADKDRDIMLRNFIIAAVALVLAVSLALLFLRNARIRRRANTLLTQQKGQVQELADQLAIANDTKARLFSTIGHDLRSPVSSLYASLKMQELQGVSTDNSMSEHTVDLLDTLEDLLAWSKSQMDGFTLQPVKVSVPMLMEDLCKFYTAAAAAKGIAIRNEAKEKIILRTDENILKTILRNAISNAVAHTTPGGAVRLSAGTEANGGIHLAVSNPCSEASFRRFQSSYNEATIQGGVHGLGIVLIKEFAQKISATVGLTYTDGNAVLRLTF